ncbi:hypothetical protein [Rhizobium lusitanum]|uniref:Uncharacterized protein n=1 Tax=Rhizobium lusitanum TaxID=293958 RepID=A0A7X0IX84_9HYPH|nr:hypothetical protein [Rhizobium lusitanum]MBB6488868.1 hypothetical protein [Rhizobium lusitanum]
MGLQQLSDDELKQFIEDPHAFVKQTDNFKKLLDLEVPENKDRVERLQRELKAKN